MQDPGTALLQTALEFPGIAILVGVGGGSFHTELPGASNYSGTGSYPFSH